jgi:hypothetical protein
MCDHDDLPEMDDDLDQDEGLPEDDDDDVDGDELPTLGDIYGYDNDEDNEEAALDDILKIQENAD